MTHVDAQFVMSIEQECMITVRESDNAVYLQNAVLRFFEIMRELAPSVPCSSGFFNGYGRVYVDCGHVELAAMECESPVLLALVVDLQQQLAAQAVSRLAGDGYYLRLASNNHSGLLVPDAPTWGTHENYLVEISPSEFSRDILPFLVTRIYAGAGGVHYPSGEFLAAVRPLFMRQDVGGGTTHDRAVHSTCREEHHLGPERRGSRYHNILGDGHRSCFNLVLQLGATALALKAIQFDPGLGRRVTSLLCRVLEDSWVSVLQRFNRLAGAGQPPRVDPLVIAIQRCYWDAARRYVKSLRFAPSWTTALLQDWHDTLDALEQDNRAWLAARLDAFAKYELYSAVLREAGCSWSSLPGSRDVFHELALLDQDYHSFSNPNSLFDRLERAGLLQHRVSPRLSPGSEAEPFVPETSTRARARARFIRDHAGQEGLVMDWSGVLDSSSGAVSRLADPFAVAYGPWLDNGFRRIREILERIG